MRRKGKTFALAVLGGLVCGAGFLMWSSSASATYSTTTYIASMQYEHDPYEMYFPVQQSGRYSNRYFAGNEILFPEARESLDWSLETIDNLRDIYAESIVNGTRESDEDFQKYILTLASNPSEMEEDDGAGLPDDHLPEVSRGAKRLAARFILMAKSETLEQLGEHDDAERLADSLVREQVGIAPH